MIHRSRILLLAPAAAALMAACSTPVKLNDTPVETRDTHTTTTTTDTTGQSTVGTIDQTKAQPVDTNELPRVVYFDFDSYVVKDDFRPVIDAHAALLKGDKSKREVAEGHTDDRGGSEYNLALGQKRAEAVVKSLELLGVGTDQLEAVSYGKERPAVQGENEEAWAKNRRVELRSK